MKTVENGLLVADGNQMKNGLNQVKIGKISANCYSKFVAGG